MKFNIHAGHGADNSKSCGAVGLIKESTEARKVKEEVIRLLRERKHIAYDCTIDYPSSANDCLNRIVSKCNANRVDLNVSIHFNSGVDDKVGNGKTTGVEVLVYNNKTNEVATRICNNISSLGFKDRGVKVRTELAVLRKTIDKAILVECCFVDDKDDINKYNYKTMAKAIVEGLLNEKIQDSSTNNTTTQRNYAILYDNNVDKISAEIVSWGTPNSTLVNVNEFNGGYWGVIAIGEEVGNKLKTKFPSINFTHIAGKDRYDTVHLALKHLGK